MGLEIGRRRVLLAGVAVLLLPSLAGAQTIVNLTNLPPSSPSAAAAADTALDAANLATALSNGNIPGAVSQVAQSGANSLNIAGLPGGTPVVLGGGAGQSISINMLAAAGYTQGDASATTSLSVGNSNAAVANGLNQIIGNAPQLGYGGQIGAVLAGGSQSGVNTLNAASVAVADGSSVALSQMPAVVNASGGYVEPTAASLAAALPLTYGASGPGVSTFDATLATNPVQPNLNLSVVNTLLGYAAAGGAGVGGRTAGAAASQAAVNTFNTATIAGAQGIAAQQLADFPTVSPLGGTLAAWMQQPTTSAMQSVNTATAYDGQLGNANVTGGAVMPGDVTSVANLAQGATTSINVLNVAPTPQGGAAGGAVALTGLQSGSLPWVISANQAAASSGAGSGTYGVSNGILLSANGSANWAGLAAAQAGVGLPAPDTVPSVAALPAAATTTVSNVSQSIGLALNGVSATQNVAAGPTGFQQSIGSMALTTSVMNDATANWNVSLPPPLVPYSNFAPAAVNAATAVGGAGQAGVGSVQQSFQVGGNTIGATGGVSGTLTQSAGLVDYGAAGIVPAASQSGFYPGLTPNSGAGAQQGAAGSLSAGPYIASPGAIGSGAALNGAVALVLGSGVATLGHVAQTASGTFNLLNAGGVVSSGASGTITQQMATLANYGGTLNNQIAMTGGAGAASVTAPSQAAALSVNTIVAGGGLNGSVAQTAPNVPLIGTPVQPSNAIAAVSMQSSGASIVGAGGAQPAQSNVQTFNVIASGTSIGNSGAVASVIQTAPAISYMLDGVAPASPANGIQASSFRPDNALGTVSNTQISGASQVASLGVNGLSAPAGAYGTITQVSNGLVSSLSNAQAGISGFCPTCALGDAAPRYAVGSGNTQIVNAAQSNAQSVNTSALGGGIIGTMNVAVAGATNLTTTNLINGMANLGNSKVSGTQVVANAVSVVSSGH